MGCLAESPSYMNSVAVTRGVRAHRRKPKEGAAHVEQACTCLQHRRKLGDVRELRIWPVCYTPRLFEQRSTKLFASSRRGMNVAPYGFFQTHRSPVEGARAARSGSRASPATGRVAPADLMRTEQRPAYSVGRRQATTYCYLTSE